jgi:hypothetical protein
VVHIFNATDASLDVLHVDGNVHVDGDVTADNFYGNFIGDLTGTADYAHTADYATTSNYANIAGQLGNVGDCGDAYINVIFGCTGHDVEVDAASKFVVKSVADYAGTCSGITDGTAALEVEGGAIIHGNVGIGQDVYIEDDLFVCGDVRGDFYGNISGWANYAHTAEYADYAGTATYATTAWGLGSADDCADVWIDEIYSCTGTVTVHANFKTTAAVAGHVSYAVDNDPVLISYTVQSDDYIVISAGIDIILPDATANVGRIIWIRNTSGFPLPITGGGTIDLILGGSTIPSEAAATFVSDGAGWVQISQ